MNHTITTETRDAFANLRDLTTARNALSVDWKLFGGLLGDIAGADTEALRARLVNALIGARTSLDMTTERAQAAVDLMVARENAEDEARDIPDADLCELLHELVADADVDGLALALRLARFDSPAYVEHLRALADATNPGEPADPARLRTEQVTALKASAKQGHTIGDELAGAIVDALTAWHAIQSETPQQKATREAFAEARRLLDLHGEDDPRAFAAVVRAIELQDPGICDRKLAECGITLPAPTHCAADGQPLFSLEEIAKALDADPDDLMQHVDDMEAVGLNVRHVPAGTLQ